MKKINLLLAMAAMAATFQACSGNKTATRGDSTAVKTDSTTTTVKTDSATVLADTAFAAKAAVGGMAEVALGKMAAAKGSDSQVKDFGNMMVTDHGKANAELMSIAKAKNITLPAGLDAEHQAISDSLSKLSGKDFDKAYISMMVDDHKKDIKAFENEAKNGSDADIRAFADSSLHILRMHLADAEKCKNMSKKM